MRQGFGPAAPVIAVACDDDQHLDAPVIADAGLRTSPNVRDDWALLGRYPVCEHVACLSEAEFVWQVEVCGRYHGWELHLKVAGLSAAILDPTPNRFCDPARGVVTLV